MDAALKAVAEPRRREILGLVWTSELRAMAIADAHGGGWAHYLGRLATRAAGGS